ncbi:MAG: hypothetical protein ACOVQA_12170 [Thermoflexibacteraceae bacterium]
MKRYIALLCLSFSPFLSFGQDKGLQDKELIIEKNKVLELSKANRNMNRMSKTPIPAPKTTQTYNNTPVLLSLPPIVLTAKPYVLTASSVTDENSATTTNSASYIRGGFGNYITPYLEAYWQPIAKQEYGVSAHLRHLSSVTGSVLDEKSGVSNNLLRLQGYYQLGTGKLEADFAYQRLGLSYYGFDKFYKNGQSKEDDIFQAYNNLATNVGYSNNSQTNWQYAGKLNLYRFTSRKGLAESNVGLQATSAWQFDSNSSLKVALQANSMIYTNEVWGNVRISRNLVGLQPSYQWQNEQFGVEAGLNLMYDTDTSTVQSKVRLYPLLKANYQLMPQKLQVYAQLSGTTQRTTLQQLAMENNFLGNQIALLHTNQLWETQVGIKGHLTPELSFDAQTSYGRYRNLYFFNANAKDSARFAVVYEPEAIGVWQLQAAVYMSLSQLKVGWQTHIATYNVKTLSAAFHRPTWTNTLYADYYFNDKLRLSSKIYNLNGISAFAQTNNDNSTKTLNSIVDVNVAAQYQFLPQWAAFLQVNNILGTYQRYAYYDTQGINGLLGVQWSFK